jgi:L-threonylcarbamoyladenylate synthase
MSWPALVDAVPPAAHALGRAFWPGAFSIALAARSGLDPRLTLDGSVAVRVPGPSQAADLARAFGKPLTATSANLPGAPPATSDAEVQAMLGAAVERGILLVSPGRSPGGLPSTLVLVEAERVRLVREGRVELARVRKVLAPLGLELDVPGRDR